MPDHEQPNPIVQVGLSALPGEWQLKMTGEKYVGIYHLHEDGTAMAGSGVLGEKHDIIPEKVIVEQQEEVSRNINWKLVSYHIDMGWV